MKKEYSINILNSIEHGHDVFRDLERTFLFRYKRYFVFLFSMDEEINRYTLYYLPLLRKEKDISTFVIIVKDEENLALIKEHCKVPYITHICSHEESHDLCRYFYSSYDIQYKRNILRFIINGSVGIDSERIYEYIGYNEISKKEAVALAFFQFDHVPDDAEMEKALNYKPVTVENIDWSEFPTVEIQEPLDFPLSVDKGLDSLLVSGKIHRNDNIVIFSNTKTTRHIIDRLNSYNIGAILDNNSSLSGTECHGIKIYTPLEYLSGAHDNSLRIIVPTKSYKAICEQLYSLGYYLGKQVFVTYTDYNPYNSVQLANRYRHGKEIYEKIREKYPKERLYFVTYPGIGDTCLAAMYLKDRMRYDNANAGVVVFITNTCSRVFSILDHEVNIAGTYVVGNNDDAMCLLLYVKQIGYNKTNVCNITHSYDLLDPVCLRGYKGLDFNTMLQRVAFHAPEKRTTVPLKSINSGDLFSKMNLTPGRTVLLAPEAKASKELPAEMWVELAKVLKKLGYDVCTNAVYEEDAVEGTRPVMVPLEAVSDFISKAGVFIGLRSGLCDLISGVSAKKIILYPTGHQWGENYVYNFFSLEKMGLSDKDTYEFIIPYDYHVTLDKIVGLCHEPSTATL